MTTVKVLAAASRGQGRVASAALLLLFAYAAALVAAGPLSRLETELFPVVDELERADGSVEYLAFAQEVAYCDGRDAYVGGYLRKVRSERSAEFIAGSQLFYLGTPDGRRRRLPFNTDTGDPQTDYLADGPGFPATRPPGISDWGFWRLRGACAQGKYDSWFTVVTHRPWHRLWFLKTTLGPFPLPSDRRP